jgi:hypothetical protein
MIQDSQQEIEKIDKSDQPPIRQLVKSDIKPGSQSWYEQDTEERDEAPLVLHDSTWCVVMVVSKGLRGLPRR